MPEYIEFKESDFKKIEKFFKNNGFRKVTEKEEQQMFERLALGDRKLHQEGSNTAFIFSVGRLSVKVYTTFSRESKTTIKENRCAWVSLLDGDTRIYSSPQIRRTKNFIQKLMSWSLIVKTILESQPLCPECKAKMYPKRNKKGTKHWWECNRTEYHSNGKVEKMSWNIFKTNLSLELKEFYQEYEKEQKIYQEYLKKKGKTNHVVGSTRTKRPLGRPENVE
ncbi:MAG: hypothetical protein MRY57_04200 [Candidatus Pacebacteria bacterium]|nr:hypothetical protein [Candidatus Paceibacterota bacterium]